MIQSPLPENARNLEEQLLSERIPVGWPWRLLIFSALIFAIAIFVYFGLRYGYKGYLDSRSRQLDEDLKALGQQVSAADQERFINFYSQLVNLKEILDKHSFSSNIFRFLENNTINEVYYTEVSLRSTERVLILKGFSNNFESLSAQLEIFEKSSETEKVILNNVSLQGNGVNFSATIIFKNTLLNKLTQV